MIRSVAMTTIVLVLSLSGACLASAESAGAGPSHPHAGPPVGPYAPNPQLMGYQQPGQGAPVLHRAACHDPTSSWEAHQSAQTDCGPILPSMILDRSDCYELTFTLDALFLTRTGLEGNDFVFDAMGNTVLNNTDFDFDFQAGPRASILLGGRVSGLEFAGFGFNKHGGTTRVSGNGVVPVFFNAIPAEPVNTYDIVSTAKLYSFESNFWFAPHPRVRFGGGLRWLELSGVFDVIFASIPGKNGFFGSAENNLYGGQLVGGVTVLELGNLAVDITAKWGAYNNNFVLDAVTLNEEIHDKDDKTAFLTELNVGFDYFISRHLSLRAGYTIYWFENVGLALEQSDNFNVFTEVGTFDYDSPIYQGGYFGLQFRW